MVNMSGSKRARQQDSIKNKPTCGGSKKSGLMRFTGMDSSISFSRFGIKSDTRPVYGMNCPGNFSIKRNQTCAGGVGKHVTMRHCGNGDGSSRSLSNEEILQLILNTLINGGNESDILDIIQNTIPNINLPGENIDAGVDIKDLVNTAIELLRGDRYISYPVPVVDDEVKISTFQCKSYLYDGLSGEMTINGGGYWLYEGERVYANKDDINLSGYKIDVSNENTDQIAATVLNEGISNETSSSFPAGEEVSIAETPPGFMFQITHPITVTAGDLSERALYFLQSKLVNFCSISNSLPVVNQEYAIKAGDAIEYNTDLFFAAIELMAIAHSIPVYTSQLGMSSAWVVGGGTRGFCQSLYTPETLARYIAELYSLIISLLAQSVPQEAVKTVSFEAGADAAVSYDGPYPTDYGTELTDDSEFYFVQAIPDYISTSMVLGEGDQSYYKNLGVEQAIRPFFINRYSRNDTDSIEDGWEPIKLGLMIQLLQSGFEKSSILRNRPVEE